MPFLDIFSKKKIKSQEKIKIIVDNRERNSNLIPVLLNKNIEIEFKQLPVADYIINNIAIERKTISDLKSSIINKRIIQQILELKQFKQHILLIEGLDENIYTGGIHENALRGFLLAVALEYQTPLIFTQNAEDTAKYLLVLAKRKSKKEFSIRPSKVIKNDMEQKQFILEGFQNIGPATAKKLLNNFKSLRNIFNANEEELSKIIGKKAQNFKSLLDKIN